MASTSGATSGNGVPHEGLATDGTVQVTIGPGGATRKQWTYWGAGDQSSLFYSRLFKINNF